MDSSAALALLKQITYRIQAYVPHLSHPQECFQNATIPARSDHFKEAEKIAEQTQKEKGNSDWERRYLIVQAFPPSIEYVKVVNHTKDIQYRTLQTEIFATAPSTRSAEYLTME